MNDKNTVDATSRVKPSVLNRLSTLISENYEACGTSAVFILFVFLAVSIIALVTVAYAESSGARESAWFWFLGSGGAFVFSIFAVIFFDITLNKPMSEDSIKNLDGDGKDAALYYFSKNPSEPLTLMALGKAKESMGAKKWFMESEAKKKEIIESQRKRL